MGAVRSVRSARGTTGGTFLAFALRYEAGKDRAPRVVASARGELAGRLAEVAQAHGVPVLSRPAVAQALAALCPPGSREVEIPPALYHAVAEVFAFVLRLGATSAGGAGGPSPALAPEPETGLGAQPNHSGGRPSPWGEVAPDLSRVTNPRPGRGEPPSGAEPA